MSNYWKGIITHEWMLELSDQGYDLNGLYGEIACGQFFAGWN